MTPASHAADPPLLPAVSIVPLRDGGGLPPPEAGDAPLPLKLTGAVVATLADEAAGAFTLLRADAADVHFPRPRFTLQGTLSRPKPTGPYVLALELSDSAASGASAKRPPLAHWTGEADTFRDLTGNLRADPRVNDLGLVGELCHRVAARLRAADAPRPPRADWSARLSALPRARRLRLTFVSDAPLPPPRRSVETLSSGEAYHYVVSSRDAGQVLVVEESGAEGDPSPRLISDHLTEIAALRPVPLPDATPLLGPLVSRTVTRRVWALFRRKPSSSDPPRPTPADDPLNFRDLPMKTLPRAAHDPSPAVRIVDADDGLAEDTTRLLRWLEDDSAGAWSRVAMTIRFTPP